MTDPRDHHGAISLITLAGMRRVDVLGHPYTHLGRHGLYYRKRWPAVTTRPPVAPPTGHPPAGTHGRIGWGWILLLGLVVGLVVANLLGR